MATITSATSGDYATGATWVWWIAPVLGDKAIIAHTSTGLAQFSTDATWYAIGATAITLTGTVLAWSFVINENESHHKFANDKIITTIEDIEKGINTEIKSVNKELSTDNVATRQLIRQKAKKQEEFIQKQLDNEAKTQKMIESEADEIEQEIEQIHNKEADMIESEIKKQHESEADEIESNL